MGSVRFEGVRFNVYSHDHEPPHVHAAYAELRLVVILFAGDVLVREGSVVPSSASRSDIRHVLRVALRCYPAHYRSGRNVMVEQENAVLAADGRDTRLSSEAEVSIDRALDYARAHPPLATVRAVEYLPKVRILLMHMKDGSRVPLPIEDVEELAQAADEQLQHFQIEGGGGLVHFPDFDGNLDVPFIAAGGRGGPKWMEQLESKRAAHLKDAA